LKINLNRLKLVIMEVKAIIHEAEEGGYWAEVPAFPGCVTQAETVSELESKLNEAVQAWLLAGEVDIKTVPNDQTLLVAV
jgi:predicted RNase H-like HicB family nuclease